MCIVGAPIDCPRDPVTCTRACPSAIDLIIEVREKGSTQPGDIDPPGGINIVAVRIGEGKIKVELPPANTVIPAAKIRWVCRTYYLPVVDVDDPIFIYVLIDDVTRSYAGVIQRCGDLVVALVDAQLFIHIKATDLPAHLQYFVPADQDRILTDQRQQLVPGE